MPQFLLTFVTFTTNFLFSNFSVPSEMTKVRWEPELVASEKSKVRDPVDLFSGGVVGHSTIERVHTNAHSAETAPGIIRMRRAYE